MKIELESLVGEHQLSGAFFDSTNDPYILAMFYCHSECHLLRFTLDGIHYEAIEDANDGYRSTLGELRTTETPPKNSFAPVNVVAGMSSDADSIVLQIRNTRTGNIIIEIGTSDASDYYPGFVGYFSPENL